MKILNYGSLNIDNVYDVDHIVAPGETISSYAVAKYPGGKGLNQTLAIARAGAHVDHAGMIGEDGKMLMELLQNDGVGCQYIKTLSVDTGNAFIQVDKSGQNSIVLSGGANQCNTAEFVDDVLKGFKEGDIILLQNEINMIDVIIKKASEKKMFIVLNPSPMNEKILACGLDRINLFIMNENEGRQITGESDNDAILAAMRSRYPNAKVVFTLGSAGAIYQHGDQTVSQKAYKVKAVDTTAAGDTFTGYFIAAMAGNKDIKSCLEIATKAAALSVMTKGAACSIPYMTDVQKAQL